ncbi:MAG: hypothetical protein GY934_03460, partial [Gammaproteobacteria bacterium]|nr:hypothetical protein [Gammaproteobacteria bacterium]
MKEQVTDATRMRNLTARQVALAGVDQQTAKPTGLIKYHSQGRVVVIGGAEAMALASHLNDTLHPQVLLTQGHEQSGIPVIPLNGRALAIEGFLGSFKIYLGERGSHDAENLSADLIVDL